MSAPGAAAKLCPTCGQPEAAAYHPFCSKRCADLDLSRWLKGVYVIPGPPLEADEDEVAPAGGVSRDD